MNANKCSRSAVAVTETVGDQLIDCNQHGYIYSGCQKNGPYTNVILLQPLMPPFLISEYKYEKRCNYHYRK